MRNLTGYFFILVFASCSAQTSENCNISDSIHLGSIDNNWVYENPEPAISYKLPQGWYFMNDAGQDRCYVKIGSNLNNIASYLFDIPMTLQQLSGNDEISPTNLFTILKLNDTATKVYQKFDLYRNQTIRAALIYSTQPTDEDFLLSIYNTYAKQKKDSMRIYYIPLGNTTFRCFDFSSYDLDGKKIGNLVGVKKVDCVYVTVNIIFRDLSDLDECKKALSNFKLNSKQ
jgi:hypothetical protein